MTAAAASAAGSSDDVLGGVIARALLAFRPPRRMPLSEWADEYFVLSAETAAEPGRWRTLPYQQEILDALNDPSVTQVTVMKSARVGYTLMISAAIAYHIAHDPSSMLIVQPTVEGAKGFSKETIAPMLRDVPVLARIAVKDEEDEGARGRRGRGRRRRRKSAKDSSATLTHKSFPGGVLSLVGANSGAGFRRVSRRVVMFDEVDAYPASAGSEGDPISLGIKRAEAYHNRKIIAGSTPLLAGSSRIAEMFEAGDQRRYHVPCPQCGHMDFLTFREESERGHYMRWPEGQPEKAFFVCRGNGCVIEHRQKRQMVRFGRWIAGKPGDGRHRSYHLWSAYSFSPNATWADIAREFVAAKRDPKKLQTFINTTLGEVWQERGEAPDWERLYERREHYPIGTIPVAAVAVTAGVDVQQDRLVYEIVAWLANKESFSVEAGVLWGDTSLDSTWVKLDELLGRSFPGVGEDLPISLMAIDSGYSTQQVYGWARGYPMNRVIACKGVQTERALVGAPSSVDVTIRGKKLRAGYRVWPVGASLAKGELYGWLRLRIAEGEEAPPGFCHFPEYSEGFFKELTAEHLVTRRTRKGRTVHEWQILPGRENHQLDARVLARAAAYVLGLDRMRKWKAAAKPAARAAAAGGGAVPATVPPEQRPAPVPIAAPPPPAPPPPARPPAGPSWLNKGGRVNARPGGWLSRRR
jgi:phage terminase large subunit GpA-like protein